MTYEIVTDVAAARPIAAVHRQVPIGGVAAAWRPALDQVWAFLRRHEGLRTDGHNIFVYHHPARPGDPLEVDFGVEVAGAFESEGDVVFAHTPAGPVASTLHVGPIARLGDASAAIEILVRGEPPDTRRRLVGDLRRSGPGRNRRRAGRLPPCPVSRGLGTP